MGPTRRNGGRKGQWNSYSTCNSGTGRGNKFVMQFAAVVVDQPLFVLGESSIEIYSSKKMLACTGEVLHFFFNPHGLPVQVTCRTTGFG